jgi:predicted phosphoadenosine phosphosulfate sulfurtransferase
MPPEARTHLPGFPAEPPAARLPLLGVNGLLAPPRLGNCVMLMGIRAEESLVRNHAVQAGGKTRDPMANYIIPYSGATARGNLWKGYPIYDWRTEDVWTGPAQLGWDYNAGYDRLEAAGRGAGRQRMSPAFGEQPIQALHEFSRCFPDVWAKMPDRVPGAGAAYRYGLTELYSFRGRPEKPEGVSWPDFLLHYVNMHGEGGRAITAGRLRRHVKTHYFKAPGSPILPDFPHPETGVDWNWLLLTAMRGDFKERAQPHMRITLLPDGRRPVRDWEKWAVRYRQVLAEGATAAELGHPRPLPPDPWPLLPDYAREALPHLAP